MEPQDRRHHEDRRVSIEVQSLPSWGDVASVCAKAIVLLTVIGVGVGAGAGVAIRVMLFFVG